MEGTVKLKHFLDVYNKRQQETARFYDKMLQLETDIKHITGHTLEELKGLFAAGYTLEPPKRVDHDNIWPDYKMPEAIKKEFTKRTMACFLEELIDIFNITHEATYYGDIVYMESTAGWCEAFEKMCINYGLEDVLGYYKKLEWYDSDIFDREFGGLLLEYGLIEEGEVE